MTKKERGLTLIELLCTLAIVSIVIGNAIPALYHFHGNNRLWVHSQQLGQILSFARSEAIKQNSTVTLCPSQNSKHCSEKHDWAAQWLMFVDTNNNAQYENQEVLLKQINFNNIPFNITTSRKPPIMFYGNGRSEGSNTTFTFCDTRGADYAKAVILSNTGRFRFSEKKSSGKKLDC